MKPAGACFDASWRKRARVRPGSLQEVMPFVRRHYIGKRPAVVVATFVIELDGAPVGMVLFSLPPRETEKRYGGQTWELARLWIDDAMPANAESWAISQAVKAIRKSHPNIRALVSYADPSAGHSGTIYRAANWASDGRTDEDRVTPRFDLAVVSTDLFGDRVKKLGRAKHLRGENIQVRRVPRVSKHRYVYHLAAAQEDARRG